MKQPFDVDKQLRVTLTLPAGAVYTMFRKDAPVEDGARFEPGTFVLEFPANSSIRVE